MASPPPPPPPPRKKSKKNKKNSLPSSSRRRPPNKKVRLEEENLPLPLPHIPDDIIFSRILPFLSSKNLEKLKLVCKSWSSFISSNPLLRLDRFPQKDKVSSSYSGVIFPECHSNGDQFLFLPTTIRSHGAHPIDFFLTVCFSDQPLSLSLSRKKLLASTDGLLCLKCISNGNDNIVLYVCNPLTKEGHVVPLNKESSSWHDTPDNNNFSVWHSCVGLAYDSSKSPDRYKLVCPWSQYFEDGDMVRLVFGFEIFSSQTNTWDRSYNKYYIEEHRHRYYLSEIFGGHLVDEQKFGPQPKPFALIKSVYAGGVLYWDCVVHLMYFDPEKGYGGAVRWPFNPFEPTDEMEDHRTGELKGRVTCSKLTSRNGMQLWILQNDNDYRWELMHQISFKTVIKTNRYVLRTTFCFEKTVGNRKMLELMFLAHYGVISIPYHDNGGGRWFMRVPLALGRKNEKEKEKVLCYDPNSGKLNKFCTILPFWDQRDTVNRHSFLYRSSMVSLPKLGKPP